MTLHHDSSKEEFLRVLKSLCHSSSSFDEFHNPENSPDSLYSSYTGYDSFKHKKHAKAGYRRMVSYFNENQLTDITLICGDKTINAHKIVLCAASDYFAAMFMTNLKEANQKEVVFHEMDGEILWKLINYCYTGKIDLHVDTVESILTTASLLQLPEVTIACCEFLKTQLHPANCIGIGLFAERQNCIDLLEAAYTYMANCFVDVVENQEFLCLPEEDLLRLLSSDDLNVSSEEEIFEALMKWVAYNESVHSINIGGLLGLVRLPLLQPSFLVDHVDTKSIIRDDPTCQTLIKEALEYHLLPERRSLLQSTRTHPRKSTVGVLYAVGGMVDSNKGAVTIEEFDLRTNKWECRANMSGRRLQFGAAIIDTILYIVGGRDDLRTLSTADCIDLKTMSWSCMPSLCTSRHGLGVSVLEGPLYAIGGHDGWSYLNTVERWDPDLRQWSYVAPMNMARSTPGVAVLNNKLYVVGGKDGSSCLKTVEQYDPHTNKWTLRASMIKRRGAVGVGVLNGYMYAVGGYDGAGWSNKFECVETVERYDPKTDSWSMIASMSIRRDSVGVGILGDTLFAIGGYDGHNYLSLVEMYDPVCNKWKRMCPLLSGRAGSCIVAVKENKRPISSLSEG